jgi:hypothetical protein
LARLGTQCRTGNRAIIDGFGDIAFCVGVVIAQSKPSKTLNTYHSRGSDVQQW